MHPNRRFEISEGIFAARLAHGRLTRREARYRAFLSCEFWELLDVDPWLATARPTAQGRRILVPLIRQVLGHPGELPASMEDWVRLYRRLVHRILEHFDYWRETELQGRQTPKRSPQLRLVGGIQPGNIRSNTGSNCSRFNSSS
jgi:hypothetical protein